MLYNTELVKLLSNAAREDRKGGNQRAQALHECLDKLPRRSQEIIQMRYDGTASGVDEIADRLGRSMAATYGVLKRIRIALRSCIETRLASEDYR